MEDRNDWGIIFVLTLIVLWINYYPFNRIQRFLILLYWTLYGFVFLKEAWPRYKKMYRKYQEEARERRERGILL